MEVLVGNKGELVKMEVDRILEISIRGMKFRIRDDGGKLRLMSRDGYLKIEPITSNVILVEQIDDI